MDKILIADDDRILCSFIRKRLQKHSDRFEVILAGNGEEAVEILNQTPISLLVTDIQMPKMDGMALLSYVNNKRPQIPCIVMTSFPTTELEERSSTDSLFRLFTKPVQLEELEKAILQALEQEMPHGTLKGISVASFLQMIQLEEKTCLFEVQAPGKDKGFFYFQKGIPYDAIYGDLSGEEAAYEIILMERAEITFRELPDKKIPQKINKEVASLILEAFRRKDETMI